MIRNYYLTGVPIHKGRIERARCFGYFCTLEEVHRVIEIYGAELVECYYNYLIVEAIEPGYMGETEVMSWYRWDDLTKAWYVCPTPIEAAHIVNFSLG